MEPIESTEHFLTDRSGQTVFHAGLYCEGLRWREEMSKRLGEIRNEDFVDEEGIRSELPSPYENADVFRQGSCQLFSLALHQKFGYDAYEIRYGSDFHYFCEVPYHGVKVYIDVRGATSDFDEFIVGTDLPQHDWKCYQFTPQDYEKDGRLDQDVYDVDGLAFAQKLISDHPEYYKVQDG